VEPDQRCGERKVPQQLVEERRMERRIGDVAVGPMVAVDLECPRQVSGPPEQLLVEVVADAPDRLGHKQRRGGRVQEIGQARARAPGPPPADDRAPREAASHAPAPPPPRPPPPPPPDDGPPPDPAPNAQPSLPHGERPPPVLERVARSSREKV